MWQLEQDCTACMRKDRTLLSTYFTGFQYQAGQELLNLHKRHRSLVHDPDW